MSKLERDPTDVHFCGAKMGFSRTVQVGDVIYFSGHTAVDADGHIGRGEIREQTLLTLDKLEGSLSRVGCSVADIAKITVYLADARDFWIVNDIFNQFFGNEAPARTTVVAQPVLATRIEIDAIAHKPQ